MIVPRASRPEDGYKTEPQGDRAERKAAKNEKHRAVTDLLGNPPANRGTKRSTETLRGHHRALLDIDTAGAVEDTRHKARYSNALQSSADPVKYLDGKNTHLPITWAAIIPRIGSATKEIKSTSQYPP
jgi:hypothetical protein